MSMCGARPTPKRWIDVQNDAKIAASGVFQLRFLPANGSARRPTVNKLYATVKRTLDGDDWGAQNFAQR